jgi:hypothetical protein
VQARQRRHKLTGLPLALLLLLLLLGRGHLLLLRVGLLLRGLGRLRGVDGTKAGDVRGGVLLRAPLLLLLVLLLGALRESEGRRLLLRGHRRRPPLRLLVLRLLLVGRGSRVTVSERHVAAHVVVSGEVAARADAAHRTRQP